MSALIFILTIYLTSLCTEGSSASSTRISKEETKRSKSKSNKDIPASCDSEWQQLPNYNVPTERIMYISCVEEKWNYCPFGENLLSGEPIVEGSLEATWCLDGIGAEYMKGLWREFESVCFNSQKQRTERQKHLGAVGPEIRALTGEKMKIFYRNACSFPNSMHAHGLKADKKSEGAPYLDGTGSTEGDVVMPGDKWIYVWEARESNVDSDVSSQMWLYHSHTDGVGARDVYTGLFGPIIITKNGMQTSETRLIPKDIDREFSTFLVVYDENNSWLSEENLMEYLGLDPNAPIVSTPEFIESNMMNAINGFLFANNKEDYQALEGEKVRWYTAGFGPDGGMHAPHWHGNIAKDSMSHNVDTLEFVSGTTKDITMDIDLSGEWLFHCHIREHLLAGMYTTYNVQPK